MQFIILMMIKGTKKSHMSVATIRGTDTHTKQSRGLKVPSDKLSVYMNRTPYGQSGLYPSLTDTPS